MVRVGRPINGISINGLEFLLNDDGSKKHFINKESAEAFLFSNGVPVDDLELFTYQEKIHGKWVII